MRRSLVLGLFLIPLGWLAWAQGRPIPRIAAEPEPTIKALSAQVEALKGMVPDQAHIMADVGAHFTNLWFAGRASNWPLADFYLGETKSHLQWAVRVKPIRKDAAGKDFKLADILDAFENGPLTQIKRAIDAKDGPAFERTYKDGLTICYSCHKTSDKPYLRPQVPAEPEVKIINFDPRADWPL